MNWPASDVCDLDVVFLYGFCEILHSPSECYYVFLYRLVQWVVVYPQVKMGAPLELVGTGL